jgi:Family of unknown function (DUF5683)
MSFVFMPVMQVKSQNAMKPDTVGATLITSDTIVKADTLESATDTLKYLKHSPTKAALYSAILPGLGQIYNKKYWKLPIVYVGLGVAGYYLQRNLKLYRQYLKGYQDFNNNHDTAAIKNIPLISQYSDKIGALQFYTNTYRTYRDWSYFAVSLIYVLNIIDASVDAYFFYYDISDNLSLKVKPTLLNAIGNYSVVGLKLSFDIH